MEKKIFKVLNELGVTCDLSGRRYLECAIEYVVENGVVKLTRTLYPFVAKKFNSTPARIERAIRHTVENAFYNCPPEVAYKYFGNTVSYESGILTNGQFICGIAEYLRVFDKD